MLVKYLVLTLLPSIVCGRISITIKVNSNGAGASLDLRGEDVELVTDEQRELFKVNDEALKKATEVFNSKSCSDVFVKPPTPWGDVYKKHGWDTVKTTLRPFHSSVTGFSSKPVTLGVQEYANTNDKNATYNMKVVEDIIESVTHTWTKGKQVGVGREVEYNVKFGEKSVGGSTSLSYAAPWGESITKSRSITVGDKTATSASIPAGGKILAKLKAIQHSVEVEIRYEALLDGYVFCNYKERYNGHNFYAFRLRELQHAARTPMTVYAIETISLSYYTNVKLEMNDGSKQ